MSETITEETARKIARLARLRIAEADLKRYADQITGIMAWIEQLNEVNTDGVKPMASVVDELMSWRTDAVNDGGYAKDVLANAPDAAHGFFMVPKVVE